MDHTLGGVSFLLRVTRWSRPLTSLWTEGFSLTRGYHFAFGIGSTELVCLEVKRFWDCSVRSEGGVFERTMCLVKLYKSHVVKKATTFSFLMRHITEKIFLFSSEGAYEC